MKFPGEEEMRERNRRVSKAMNRAFESLGGLSTDAVLMERKRRAAPLRRAFCERSIVLLRDAQGLLRWEIGSAPLPSPGHRALANAEARRRNLRRAPLSVTPVLTQNYFDRIEPSKIGEWLKVADEKLTRPAWNQRGDLWGLRRLTSGGKLVPFEMAELPKLRSKKVLILVHGTFSNSDALLADLMAAPTGPDLISAAVSGYDYVLSFDHPTLGQSPTLNAFDLASRLSIGVPASVDLIAHSRGGLVVRWFCEAFRHPSLRCRAILVGSPLAGTSLAAPARAKAAMDFLANAGEALSLVSGLGGGIMFGLASTLAGVFAKVAGALSTPLADAIIAMVPGLAAQSREGGNVELRALRVNTGAFDFSDPNSPVRYAVIRSHFDPSEDGVWGFIKSFAVRPGAVILGAAANLIFEKEHDLVVDTESMAETGELPGPPTRRAVIATMAHDFGKSTLVHHCNYFQQRETIRGIRSTLVF